MVTITRYDFASKAVSEMQFDETIFGDRTRHRLLRDVVLMYAANRRQGTADTKERAEVTRTTKKPWKQKHTGRARAGSARSPLWRGGGTIFGPHPRDYGYQIPRQALVVALRGAMFGKLRDREVAVVSNLNFAKPSAKAAREMFINLTNAGLVTDKRFTRIGDDASVVVVIPDYNKTTWASLRNFPKVSVKTVAELNADDVVRNRVVLLTEEAVGKMKSGFRSVALAKDPSEKSATKSTVKKTSAPKKAAPKADARKSTRKAVAE